MAIILNKTLFFNKIFKPAKDLVYGGNMVQYHNHDSDAKAFAEFCLPIIDLKINSSNPFEWARGYRMPIDIDFSPLVSKHDDRNSVRQAFENLCNKHGIRNYEYVVGTSSAGISPATTFADIWQKDLLYVKREGLDYIIKGKLKGENFEGKNALVFDDWFGTASTDGATIQAVRNLNINVVCCASIFTYRFDLAAKVFQAKEPYDDKGHILTYPCDDKDHMLPYPCKFYSIFDFSDLIEAARNHYSHEQLEVMEEVKRDELDWGANHGFPRVNPMG